MTRAGHAPVAVVVVTHDSAAFIEDCLKSLLALSRPPEEIVVVNSGSSDATEALVRRACPDVLWIPCGTNAGFCRANNLGIARTRAPFVLVLNPDTKLSADFLEALLPAFQDPRVGIAAGKLLRFDGRTINSAGQTLGRSRQPIDRGYGLQDAGQYDRDEEVFSACGAAALYRRAMLEAVADSGGAFFDEAFFAFYEDLDLAWRAGRLGFTTVYRHRALGFHFRGGTTQGTGPRRRFQALARRDPDLRYHIVKNRYLTILRNDTPRAYVRNLPFILARDLATAGFLLAASPGVLARLWRTRGLFRRALALRRLDRCRAGHHVPVGTGPDPEKGSVRPRSGSSTTGAS